MNSVIYTRIKELCAEQGISVKKLEQTLGMAPGSIGKWKASSSPSVGSIAKIAQFFHCSADYLLGLSNIRATADDLVGDRDFISIQRARQKMPEGDRNRMDMILRLAFSTAFSDEENQDSH